MVIITIKKLNLTKFDSLKIVLTIIAIYQLTSQMHIPNYKSYLYKSYFLHKNPKTEVRWRYRMHIEH